MLDLHKSRDSTTEEIFRKIRTSQVKHAHRNLNKIGDQITGDYVTITDMFGRGGVHGGRHLYVQKELGADRIDAVPTSKQDNAQTTAAMMQILGSLPRRNYYSDNQLCLINGARANGMNTENSLQGVSQTNGVAETTNKTVVSGTRKLLCQAGLPACWWTYAAPCFCFQRNA